MAIMGTGSINKALYPGVKAWVGLSYDEKTQQYIEIFEVMQSDKNYEQDVTLGGMGLMQVKTESQGITYDDIQQGFTKNYNHITYANGFIVSREHVEDNQYEQLTKQKANELGRSARATKENVAANVLNLGFTSALAADGVAVLSASHKHEKGGTYRNILATAADLSELALEQACIDIMDLRDGAGKLIAAMPRKLVVPTALAFVTERILMSNLQNNTANNAINALRSKNILPEGYCVNNYLTDNDAWFVLTDVKNGMKFYQRRAMEITDESDFDTENLKFKVTERYSVGCTDPRGIFGSPGS